MKLMRAQIGHSNRGASDLREFLISALINGGWKIDRSAQSRLGIDALAHQGDRRYAIDVKVAQQSRLGLVEGLLASAILRARHAADELRAAPLAIVGAPVISDRALAHLANFAQVYGEGVSWGAIDGRGMVSLHGPGLENLQRAPARRARGAQGLVPSRFGLFSDLSQWMLKVLLSHRLPEHLQILDQEGRRVSSPVRNAAALAPLASVSVPSAARLVKALVNEGFCDRREPLELGRIDDLLARWRAANQGRSPEVRAKWLFRGSGGPDQLGRVLSAHDQREGSRACLALFEASRQLGFDFVSGVSPHLYVERLSEEALQGFGLVPAEAGEGVDVFARAPRFPESVFRGARRLDGPAAADVLQCWLDVVDHPARGSELAEYLYDNVIAPCIVGDQ